MAGPLRIGGVGLRGTLAAILVTIGGTAAGDASIEERLASASPERGRMAFRACRACHTIDEGAAHGVGPNLWAVLGRAVAASEGFDRYTPAMTSYGGLWTPERLDRYLRNPMGEVEGTAMVYPGVPDADDRADLIAWLNLNSPSPADLASTRTASGGTASEGGMAGEGGMASEGGTAEADAAGPATPGSARLPDLGVLVAGEGAGETHAYCTVCHSERIVAQQGLTRADWEELLEQMVEENGMNPIEEPDLGRVLHYLSANYGPDRPNFPSH